MTEIRWTGLTMSTRTDGPGMVLSVSDPQAHINALVEAGVLERDPESLDYGMGNMRRRYTVVQPHKHEWHVAVDQPVRNDSVIVDCDCGDWRRVPNRLPIQVPDA